uniref:N-acetylglucosamine-6-phosphate deacetylase n=1 Tax=Gasterosteus aculeatus aculeatus TaxID=481459 RepID=A0AAQ4NVJ7_GASAC
MPSNKSVSDAPITQFVNCRILRGSRLQREDLWVRSGSILDPEKLFFDEQGYADDRVDCEGSIMAPGFIDVQINGGYGVDFSEASEDVSAGVSLVSKKILQHGVTSFCPTLVTSPAAVYHKVLPQVKVHDGGAHGAGVLGLHLEGPFISAEKKGAHPERFLRTFQAGGIDDLMAAYGSLDNVAMVTLAPELAGSQSVVRELCRRGVTVSLGHSVANLSQAEEAVDQGASFITHLFNAMLPFHHRDPGIVGLLTSDRVPSGRTVFYGMIADGIHTNPAALRIAHRAHPEGQRSPWCTSPRRPSSDVASRCVFRSGAGDGRHHGDGSPPRASHSGPAGHRDPGSARLCGRHEDAQRQHRYDGHVCATLQTRDGLQRRRSSGSSFAASGSASEAPPQGKPGLRLGCRPRPARRRPQPQSHLHFWRRGVEESTIEEEEEACRWKQLGAAVPSGDAVKHSTTDRFSCSS